MVNSKPSDGRPRVSAAGTRLRYVGMAAALLLAVTGCKFGALPERTEFVLEVNSNIRVPEQMDAVAVHVSRADGRIMLERSDVIGAGPGQTLLPVTVTLVPVEKRYEAFKVRVEGLRNGEVVVSRTILTSFVPEKSKLLRMSLAKECLGVVCAEGLTCGEGGVCINEYVDPVPLPTATQDAGTQVVVWPTVDGEGASTDGASSGMDSVARLDGAGPSLDGATSVDMAATTDVIPDVPVMIDVVSDAPLVLDLRLDLPDAKPEVPTDLPLALGPELGSELGAEPGPEPGLERGPEPGTEPAPELETEPGPEPGTESGPEFGPEPGPELPPDAGVDVPPDAPTEAPVTGFCSDKPDFTLCNVVTTPDRSYDICVSGLCVSPGCGDTTCNVPGPHFPLADTNQRKCYDNSSEMMTCPTSCEAFYGQDSHYGWDKHHAASERFTRNASVANQPVVQDNVTGLSWQGCAAGLSGNDCDVDTAAMYTWQEALAYCDGLDWGGHQDWRLPDPYELDSLVDLGRYSPSVDTTAFPATPSNDFWSSSTYADNPEIVAWMVYFGDGKVYLIEKYLAATARCVRGGPWTNGARFTRDTRVIGQPEVNDNVTGLSWQGCAAGLLGDNCDVDAPARYSWRDALAFCANLEWGGHSDWRLPNQKELFSIVYERRYGPAIDTTAFPASPSESPTWSSSTNPANLADAFSVFFQTGNVFNGAVGKGYDFFVRCVRGGPDTVVEGPGCASLAANCGPSGNESCCTALLVPGGKFYRSYDGVTFTDQGYPATVSDFYLDKFEVTVGRFRKFVEAGGGTQANHPAFGAGAHPLISGSGWYSAWDTSLPADTTALKAAFHSDCPGTTTWTDVADANEDLPMDCLTWHEAFAFCAWDGGRMPTEAEWNYAAAGGCVQREYPWGSAAPDATRAVYDFNPLRPVGSKPAGNGMWGQADLAGNVFEWNLDWAGSYVLPCNDCAYLTGSASRVLRGGGGGLDSSRLRSSYRGLGTPSFRDVSLGIRCVRTMP
jgi:formylglycine-generating enzyme